MPKLLDSTFPRRIIGIISICLPIAGYAMSQISLLIGSYILLLTGLFVTGVVGLILGVVAWKSLLGKLGIVVNLLALGDSILYFYALTHVHLHLG